MRLSVIIPTYNRARLLAETVRSALDLDYPDYEILVVDDGGTDDSEAVLKEINHPHLRYFRKERGERGAARNYGAARATGEYLNFFDSDDRFLPHHLSEARRCADAWNRPEVFALGTRMETRKGQVVRVVDNLPDPMNLVFLRGNPLGCNPVFVRRDVFQKYPFKEERALSGSEDILLWLQLASRYPFHFSPSVTSIHIDHETRSVYGYDEQSLEMRNKLLLSYLKADSVFMKTYGSFLPQIRAQRHIYTAIHLAVSGYHLLPLKHILLAARTKFTSVFHAGTVGALKHVLLGFFRPPYRPD
jgi:glycosyltransferase involved in cell wall biosynthesis